MTGEVSSCAVGNRAIVPVMTCFEWNMKNSNLVANHVVCSFVCIPVSCGRMIRRCEAEFSQKDAKTWGFFVFPHEGFFKRGLLQQNLMMGFGK